MLFRSLQTKYAEIGKLKAVLCAVGCVGSLNMLDVRVKKSRVRHSRNHAHFLFEHNGLNVKTEYVLKVVTFNC